ncbi:MAG: hypothetical protein RBR35_01180 [Salinivirgaceae bacterium]|jgi:hypothetical protein|nr:hypothetical protein [Salinivirgaceae bacterium]
MKCLKRGLIYTPPFDGSWRDNSALTPTPYLINKNTIRVFCGFRDKSGVSRIGYVDLNAANPSHIKKVSDAPILDVGQPGMFDDNGLILGDIITYQDKLLMYYVGFQLVQKVKFLAFSGLAVSSDNGESFHRIQETPVFDRAEEAKFIRAIHSVSIVNGKVRLWYATGNGWEQINGKPFPQYDINWIDSNSPYSIHGVGTKCVLPDASNSEYRIGRPRVFPHRGQYLMTFTYGTTDGRYMAGMATSKDGETWQRNDSLLGLKLSDNGWDSVHLCYPALITVMDKTYVFYNGNNMGYDGFGYAELLD